MQVGNNLINTDLFLSCIAYKSKYLTRFEKQGDVKNGCSGKSLHIIALTSQVTQQGLHLKKKNTWMNTNKGISI